MKKIIYLLILLMIPIVSALDNCKSVMLPQEAPCLILLPVNTSYKNCSNINFTLFVNGSTFLYKQSMHEYNSFKCNATFNATKYGTYTFLYNGTGDTGTILIEQDIDQQYYLYFGAIVIFFILLGLGLWKEEGVFIMISGMLAMILGITLYNYGFPSLTNAFLKNSIVVIVWGVGAYLTILPIMEYLKDK